MKSYLAFTLIGLFFLWLSCEQPDQYASSKKAPFSQKETKPTVKSEQAPRDFFNSSEYAYQLGMKSVFSSELEGVMIDDSIIDVTVTADNQTFTNMPLQGMENYSLESALSSFPSFRVDSLSIDSTQVFRLSYKESVLTLKASPDGLVPYALLSNQKIPLCHDLRVGMTADEVLRKLFNTTEIEGLISLKTIIIGELIGSYYTYLRFNNGKLSQMESGFHHHSLIDELGLKD